MRSRHLEQNKLWRAYEERLLETQQRMSGNIGIPGMEMSQLTPATLTCLRNEQVNGAPCDAVCRQVYRA